MSKLKADSGGNISGKFNIPNKIPAGTKRVEFIGEKGSRAQTTYTGSQEITVREYQRLTTITSERYDPLAQTFTLSESRHIVGVELLFTKKGKSSVRVQIRETNVGLPNQNILCESILNSNDIIANKSLKTRFSFTPIFIEAGVEYAIVVLTDDPDFEVAVAEVGGKDRSKGIVKSQPYQVGVLLSSSNASTWTPHQSMDLTFNLLAAKFRKQSRTINMGTLELENVSDLNVLAMVNRPTSETDIRFTINEEKEDGKVVEVQDNQVVSLSERLEGKVTVKSHFIGTEKQSPVLYPGTQLAQGDLKKSAQYISRVISCGENSTIRVNFDAVLPSETHVQAYIEDGNEWIKLKLHKGTPIGDEWIEQKYVKDNFNKNCFRVKLILNGTTKARPRIRRLRVTAT